MIINLISSEKCDIKSEPRFSAIINIMTAYKEGKHVIISEPELLQSIYNENDFDRRIRNAARHAETVQKQYRRLINDVNTYIVVDIANNNINKKTINENGMEVISVGCKIFSDSASVQKVNLLCEDLSDTSFYIKIGEFYRYLINLETVDIIFKPVNGGGNNTYKNFQSIVSNSGFCLCMLDSDKKHPTGKQGGTALYFNGQAIPYNGKYVVINAQEAECLIPDEIINLLIIDKKHKHYDYSFSNRLDYLKILCKSDSRAKLYFDHKDGLMVNDVKKFDKSGQSLFWETTISNATILNRSKCLRDLECKCKETPKKNSLMECYVSEGFGSKLLEDSNSKLKEMPNSKLKYILTEQLLHEWMNIGKDIFSWGCAPTKTARTS
ncbi:hypothetical protein [Yersinia aleksiciae]|uniref:Uncharacterized protein n=1 Tax=Yersinia aleksiciae TaxID=263819 RepID=A0ABM5U8A1_YERAE|nr:hypothetical protein [Yersinia aleksiciae]AKP32060.1 hypothetical protein ACZ76_00075 [Yersinia aleksiciae]CFQ33891.1 Uncharacterised protein [Yersinia aleksiciae]